MIYILYIGLVLDQIKEELKSLNMRTFGHAGDKSNRFRWSCTSKFGDYWKAKLTEWKEMMPNLDILAERVKQSPHYVEDTIIVPFIYEKYSTN
jgi:hypothetical protein